MVLLMVFESTTRTTMVFMTEMGGKICSPKRSPTLSVSTRWRDHSLWHKFHHQTVTPKVGVEVPVPASFLWPLTTTTSPQIIYIKIHIFKCKMQLTITMHEHMQWTWLKWYAIWDYFISSSSPSSFICIAL